ncbi:hypothetical protein EV207_11169 [Scopulibacillus darangshiensis]|uniref:Uncharacterized protein n=1 Tax=Scopulibacillus darangshiensis TaxID=442528 RepID=A0A4R2P3S1_9BACL|nr:hypothetical protein [Scopulibacillus darangshiensis]TCP29267.1 hypothetical protein EV207_11169 [Scopulibacillus darangshiensis]
MTRVNSVQGRRNKPSKGYTKLLLLFVNTGIISGEIIPKIVGCYPLLIYDVFILIKRSGANTSDLLVSLLTDRFFS